MSAAVKDQLRTEFFAQRRQLGDTERQLQSEQVSQLLFDWYHSLPAAHRATRKVAMTIKFGTEPDTDPLMYALHAEGVEIWVPISNADRSMFWVRWTPDVAMEQSALGPIQEPVGERFGPQAVADTDVVFVPALAADRAGYRLGKGGGYYDRFLAALPDLTDQVPHLVTPVFNHELFAPDSDAFPVDAHDLPVHAVVTAKTGLLWV